MEMETIRIVLTTTTKYSQRQIMDIFISPIQPQQHQQQLHEAIATRVEQRKLNIVFYHCHHQKRKWPFLYRQVQH